MKRLELTQALLLVMALAGSPAHAQTTGSAPGTCPSGTHAVSVSGFLESIEADSATPGPANPADIRCVPNTSPTALMCGSHGSAISIGGAAACSCSDGYAGDSCNVCAAGFEQDAAGGCQPAAVNRELVIMGADHVVPYGSSSILSAQYLSAPGRTASGTWALRGAPTDVGCLSASDAPTQCLSSVDGSEVRYTPPADGNGLTTNTVFFQPAQGLPTQVDIKADLLGQIPINGWADSTTVPVVTAVLDFMKARCVGAGSLGIARNGKVIAALGLGMLDGRSAEAIYNPLCGSGNADPFKPDAGEMQYDTPFMFGSVSKATSFATARWALKNALGAQDIDVRVISQSATRAVSAFRADLGRLRLDVWNLNNVGTATRLGFYVSEVVKDFQLVRMGDTRFVLITRSATNKLNLYAYSIDANGNPTVTDTLLGATEVKEVQVTAIKDQRVVIGLRLANDTLQVRSFKLEANSHFTALDTENGGTLRDLKLLALPGTSRVVGAVRLANPDVVKFIVWNVDDAGQLTRIHETTLDSFYWENGKLEMAALSASRIVVAAQQWPHSALGISVISVAGSGALAMVGGTSMDDVHDFRVQALSDARFAIASSDVDKNGTLQQFALSGGGYPYSVGARVNAGRYDSLDLATTSGAGWGTGVVTAVRDEQNNFRLTSWDVENSTIAKLKQSNGGAVHDHAWNDDDVEALKLIGFDFPNGLVSTRMYNILAGNVQPPFHFNAKDARSKNACSATQAPGYPNADSRWKNILLRDFFSHRAGLNDSAVAAEILLANMGPLRELTNKAQWAAQEDRLRDEWGVQHVKDARVAAGLSQVVNYASPDGFLLPRLTLEEMLVGSASTCLPNPQGTYNYSNTDPQWLRFVMEHVTGKPYSAPVGNPGAVQGTLLNDFVQSNLGVHSNGLNGIAARPVAITAQGKDPFSGPKGRDWNSQTQSFYTSYWDTKRPICTWTNNTCVVADPTKGPSLDWNGNLERVPMVMRSNGEGAATGGLGVQILPHLKFMSKYWASGYDTGSAPGLQNPSIGEPRNGVWTLGNSHNGGDLGTWAYAIQFGSTCGNSDGIDIIVSVNQWKDAQCNTDDESCVGNVMRYQNLKELIKTEVCKIDWSKSKPIPWLND
ncbi:MAG: calcium-binding EGF-like domain-containing protein [Tahibacter sp.]